MGITYALIAIAAGVALAAAILKAETLIDWGQDLLDRRRHQG